MTSDRPHGFFQLSGLDITSEIDRKVYLSTLGNINICSYQDKNENFNIELSIVCQLSEIDDSFEKLKEIVEVLNEL